MRRKIGLSLFTVGAVLVFIALGWFIRNLVLEWRSGQASQAAVTELRQMIEENEDQENGEALSTEMATIEIDGYLYIGYLTVPSLGLDLPVMASWTMESLEIAPGRYSGTLLGRDLVIAGHNYQKHFSSLKRAEIGTRIIFTDVNGNSYYYEIEKRETLKPGQITEMIEKSENDDWDMTLFTCTTGGNARCAIRCVMIEE